MTFDDFQRGMITFFLLWAALCILYFVVKKPWRKTPREKMDRAMERARRSMSERELDERRRLAKAGFIIDDAGLTACMVCGGYCGQCGDNSDHGLTLEEYAIKKGW